MTELATNPVRRACDVLLVVAFSAGILASLADHALRPNDARDTISEYRSPARLPARPATLAALRAYPKRFDAWYVDHFGLRDVFLRWHNIAKWFGLGVAPTSKILVDSGGWIYPAESLSLEDHRGAMPLSPGALARWKRMLEGRRDFLAQRGIQYLFVVAPYKSRVYAERMPGRYQVTGPTRGEQIVEYMKRRSDVHVLDVRDAVIAAKRCDTPEDRTYFPLGVHWTDRGALAAYEVIARELAAMLPSFRPLRREDFDSARSDAPSDNWGGRLYMADLLLQENIVWRVRDRRAEYAATYASDAELHGRREDASLPRAQLYHDSFALALRPWLAEGFSHLDCYWSPELELGRLDSERPVVVIQIHNEQSLLRMTPQLSREEDRGACERRFSACGEVVWRFEPERFPDGLRSEGDGRLAMDGSVLVYERAAGTGLLHLPELEYPPGADLLVRIELESPESFLSFLFFKTRLQPAVDRDHAVHLNVNAGCDAVEFDLPESEFAGRLTWWPGSKPIPLRIHSIEVRAERAK